MSKTTERLRYLQDEKGFDKSYVVRGGMIKVACSQCEALVIQGVACHETGCPNRHKAASREEEEDE